MQRKHNPRALKSEGAGVDRARTGKRRHWSVTAAPTPPATNQVRAPWGVRILKMFVVLIFKGALFMTGWCWKFYKFRLVMAYDRE